jgi:GIY-YIG catalytic domain-containing protein
MSANLRGVVSSFVIPVPIFIGMNSSRNPGGKRDAVNKQPAVYILASSKNGTLYIDVTSDLVKRIWEHRNNTVEGFTKRFCITQWFDWIAAFAGMTSRSGRWLVKLARIPQVRDVR